MTDGPQPSARWRTLAGGAAAALSLSLAWVGSKLDPDLTFGPVGLAGRIIRLSPGDVATYFIEALGTNAQRLLVAATVLLLVALGALLGRWLSGPARLAALAGACFGALLAAGSLLAPTGTATGSALLVAAAAGVVFAATLCWLVAVAALASAEPDVSRRRAFGITGSAVAGFVLGGTVLDRLIEPSSGRENVTLATPSRRASVPSKSVRVIPGLSPEVTSPADHYVVDINIEKPVVDVRSWSLEVDGLVEEPLRLDFDRLQSEFVVEEQYSVLTCVSNQVGGPLVGNSKWSGVPLGEVLRRAAVKDGAVDLALSCADGYTVSIPLERALEPSALLAIAQNDEPLTIEHGFPCRLRVPRLYGMMNAKWLERIEVVGADYRGYWAKRGWSDVGTVRTQSRIDTVSPAPRVGRQSWIAGIAWAGDRGISRVEVSLDGGRSWESAALREPLSPVAWTQWTFRFRPEASGSQLIACRAVDGEGATQDEEVRPPHPSGATGYHRVSVEVA